MKQFSNKYIYIFSIIMVIVVAVTLSVAATLLKPLQNKNIEIEKKGSILAAIQIFPSKKDTPEKYKSTITRSYVVDNNGTINEKVDAFNINVKNELRKSKEKQLLPIFEGIIADGKKTYIFPIYGKGLWGAIWGYIALKDDFNTIEGVFFDHESETPGLGGEITKEYFKKRFVGKKIFDEQNKYTSIIVIKGTPEPNSKYDIQSISGSTITSRGVEAMIYNCLENYLPFISKQKK